MKLKKKYSWIKHIDFLIIDVFCLYLSFIVAHLFHFKSIEVFLSPVWTRFILLASIVNILMFLLLNPNSGILKRSYYIDVIQSVHYTFLQIITLSIIIYLLKLGDYYSRTVFLLTYINYFILLNISKYLWKKLLISKKIIFRRNKNISLAIITNKDNLIKCIEDVSAADFNPYSIDLIYCDGYQEDNFNNIPIIRDNLIDYILNNQIDEVLVDDFSCPKLSPNDYKLLTENGVAVSYSITSLLEFIPEYQLITNLGIIKSLTIQEFTFAPKQILYFYVKRIFDILIALFGVIMLVPLFIIVKIINVLNGDTDSIVYRQERIGKDGKLIKIYKFRSMVPNAEEVLSELLKDEKMKKEWTENQKFTNDPRITKVGAFLRKTSLDELPQLINVLNGDMSLVGPRPLVAGELEEHNGLPLYRKVKPGITGWWGCNGRSNISYDERLDLEYYYVKNCSFSLDILCILRTIFAVLKKDGAR